MTPRISWRPLALALAMSPSLSGCKPGEEVFYPVEGQVKYEGKLLTKGAVILVPDATKDNASKHEPRGVIGADGRFKIITHPRQGAPAGWYKVGVISTERAKDPANPYTLPTSLIPERFGKAEESGLSLEVRKDAPPGAYDIDLR